MDWLLNSLSVGNGYRRLRLRLWPHPTRLRWSTVDRVLCGLCVAMIAGSGLKLWTTWTTLHTPAVFSSTTDDGTGLGAQPEPVAVRNVADRLPQIFGTSAPDSEKNQQSAVGAPQPTLEMQLIGIAYSADPADARAILRDQTGQLHVVPAGAAIAGGATVRTIETDAVQFDIGGRLETLKLPKTDILSKPTPVAASSSDVPTQAAPLAAPAEDTPQAQRARIDALRRQLYGAPRQ